MTIEALLTRISEYSLKGLSSYGAGYRMGKNTKKALKRMGFRVIKHCDSYIIEWR